MPSIKRALLSVSDKTEIISLASRLHAFGIDIFSTGGTSRVLKEAAIPHRQVEDMTHVKEMLNGRVKTLHPLIHGGILADRALHADEIKDNAIPLIDLVVVNFYPFCRVLDNAALPLAEVIEDIDIGGPTMVRAAAKNMAWVSVVVDPNDYATVITYLEQANELPLHFRQQLALKAFKLTAAYDAMIVDYLSKRFSEKPEKPDMHSEVLYLQESIPLRYGENPHQAAQAFTIGKTQGVLSARVHQGKTLSFNNLLDTHAALNCVAEFAEPACVIVKHGNPCGVAVHTSIHGAYLAAFKADSQAAFGGIVALNQACTEALACLLVEHFFEVIIAPHYSQEALILLSKKPNLRVLEMPIKTSEKWEYKFIDGGVLKQEKDDYVLQAADLNIVTRKHFTSTLLSEALFAWQTLKHVKSNAILVVRNRTTLGIGPGQVSRIDSVETALRKAGNDTVGAVLASDAFFPFRDSIDRIAAAGIHAIIQPGGSVKDPEVIAACDEHELAMAFTGIRCFKH